MATVSSSSAPADVLVDTTVAVSAATFARLARSQDYYRSTRAHTKFTKQEVVELDGWVPWEFQSEDQEAPSNSENCDEVVPSPPPGIKAQTTTSSNEQEGEGGPIKEDDATPANSLAEAKTKESSAAASDSVGNAGKADKGQPPQMYRKIRYTTVVSTPLGSSHNDGVQGQTLREGENEVIYTETDCVKGLSMFRGDMAIKTTYRVTRDRGDPENSVRVKVTVILRDVKLARAVGWLSKLVRKSIKDSAKNHAVQYLKRMVDEAKTTSGAL